MTWSLDITALNPKILWFLVYCMDVQSCPTLCNPMNCSPPGSSVRGIFQARTLDGLPFFSSGDLPIPGIEPVSLTSAALAGGFLATVLHIVFNQTAVSYGTWIALFIVE